MSTDAVTAGRPARVTSTSGPRAEIVVVGGGPAGLMAAEVAAAGGAAVTLFDAMPSCGRKFLLAGKGGLNLTHGEPRAAFQARYGDVPTPFAEALAAMDGMAVRAWAADLGIETFVGSSGRVFPRDLKAAPLLRRWLRRLRAAGVSFVPRARLVAVAPGPKLRFDCADGAREVDAAAVVLALGGASWPALGSRGDWVEWLRAAGVDVSPLVAANVGFACAWSSHMLARHAGAAVKNVRVRVGDAGTAIAGEFRVVDYGVEGQAIYALGPALRAALDRDGTAELLVDLAPARSEQRLNSELARPRGRHSFSHHLARRAGIDGVKATLLREVLPDAASAAPATLARVIKSLPLRLTATRPVAEAISSAGGVRFAALDAHFMLRALPGVFCAGEMLDWEAPTGGYLLTGCFASGRAAGAGALAWLAAQPPRGDDVGRG